MLISQFRLRSLSNLAILLGLLLPAGLPTRAMQLAPPESTTSARIQTAGSGEQAIIEAGDDAELFGDPVVIDGDLLAATSIYADVNGVTAGAVYLYQRDAQAPNGWKEIRKLHRSPPHNFGVFGEALALQGDTLVVGAPQDQRNDPGGSWQGAVYVYERNQGGANTWGLVAQLADEADGKLRWFGSAVAIDGNLIAVGVEGADGNQGKVFLYSRAAGWARIKTITDPNGEAGDYFGSAVAVQGDTLVVGARGGDANATTEDTGAAFVFERNQGGDNAWGLVATLVADKPAGKSLFGDALVLDGDTVVVSAFNEDVYENDQLVARQVGAAYVYERNQDGANAWGLVTALRPPDGETTDMYGSGLALSGDDIWIGAPNSNAGGFERQGILYHYQRNQGGDNAWGALPLIEADNGSLRDQFGSSLAVDGATLVAGAPGRDQSQGAAYVMNVASKSSTPTANTVFLPMLLHAWVPPTGMLVDGGSLEDSSEAIIGAVPGTLDAPVEATITTTYPPATSLPGGFIPRGDYYRVSARALTIAPADKPLLVGLPVPDNANTARLAVAAFVPDGYASGQIKPEPPTRSWTELPGSYDAANNLFVITLRALLPEGITLVLFEHPNNQPLPEATSVQVQQGGAVEYSVGCSPASQSQDACTFDNYALLATELEAAHALFVDTHGFSPPALVHLAGAFLGADLKPQLKDIYYNATVGTAPCVDRASRPFRGIYYWTTMRLVICMDAQTTADDIRGTVRHELFHAIQAAYPKVAEDYLTPETYKLTIWTLEGTAAAAKRSSFLMLRSSDYPLREATEPITSTEELYEYSTQDFWVYTGLEGEQTNHYIEYLKPIFEKGATPEHINEAIPLGDAYWEWAKNQVIEHHQPMIDAFVNGPCQLESRTIDPTSIKFLFHPDEIDETGSLPPLTSALVQIEVQQDRAILPVLASTTADEQDLRYKVYIKEEAGCKAVPDGRRTLFNVPAGSTLFVLVSNISLTEAFDYVVETD